MQVSVQSCINLLFQHPLFLLRPLLRIPQPQLRIKTMVNIVSIINFVLQNQLQDTFFHISVTPQGFISLQNASRNFSQTCILHHGWKKFMEFTSLENALNPGIFSHTPPPPFPQVSIITPLSRQRGIIQSPRQHFFEKGGGNYDLLNQNSIRKYEDHSEHQVIYILYEL